jgi:hypothetical protein
VLINLFLGRTAESSLKHHVSVIYNYISVATYFSLGVMKVKEIQRKFIQDQPLLNALVIIKCKSVLVYVLLLCILSEGMCLCSHILFKDIEIQVLRNILFTNRYMFRSYDYLQEISFNKIFPLEDGHTTEICSGY